MRFFVVVDRQPKNISALLCRSSSECLVLEGEIELLMGTKRAYTNVLWYALPMRHT